MKKIILGLFMLVFSVGAFAQGQLTEVGTYTLNGIHYDCLVNPDSKKIFIEVDPDDSKFAQIILSLSEQKSFRRFLEDVKSKYLEYDSIRNVNNIQELEKTEIKNFEIHSTYPVRFYRYTEFEYDFETSFHYNCYLIKNGILYFEFKTKVIASDNKYIDDYVSLKFYSVKEIDTLINLLDETNIDNIVNKVLNKQNLFN